MMAALVAQGPRVLMAMILSSLVGGASYAFWRGVERRWGAKPLLDPALVLFGVAMGVPFVMVAFVNFFINGLFITLASNGALGVFCLLVAEFHRRSGGRSLRLSARFLVMLTSVMTSQCLGFIALLPIVVPRSSSPGASIGLVGLAVYPNLTPLVYWVWNASRDSKEMTDPNRFSQETPPAPIAQREWMEP